MTLDDFVSPVSIPDMDHDRYQIKQPDGSTVSYTRASTFAKTLDNGYGIALWKLRQLTLGLAKREDLAAMAAGLIYSPECFERIDEIIDFALDFVGANAKRNYGTAIHSLTEPGIDQSFVPTRMRADVAGWDAALAREHVTIIDTEVYVVNDPYRVAGRLDHILHHPIYGNCVGDKKTGKLQFPYVPIQIGMYATSKRYNPDTGERTPLDVNQDVGIAAHIPAGEGTCELVPIDLRAGMLAARTAAEVRVWQATRDFILTPDDAARAMHNLVKGDLIDDPLMAEIHGTMDARALDKLWYERNPNAWTERHTAAAAAHKRTLTERVTA